MPDIFSRILPSITANNRFSVEDALLHEWAEFNLPVAQDLLVMRTQIRDTNNRESAV